MHTTAFRQFTGWGRRGALALHWGFVVGLAALLCGAPAFATDVRAADAKEARAVIEAQLAALAADDAKRAFSYAAPALRKHFGSAENFIEMVRTSYPVVYRPASVAFLKPQWIDGELVQGVHLSDENGVLWLALYRLERQKDKHWRISACQLVQAEGRVT